MVEESKLEKELKKENLPQFDSDVSPYNIINQKAARVRGLHYDAKEKIYRDDDGCPIRDKYGQPL